jgi:hypothetical protein
VIDDAEAPLNFNVLVPWLLPKFDPTTVTVVPTGPKSGETPVTKGVVPMLTDTLSKVAAAKVVVLPLLAAKPM